MKPSFILWDCIQAVLRIPMKTDAILERMANMKK